MKDVHSKLQHLVYQYVLAIDIKRMGPFRDGEKTYDLASNTCVIFFIVWVKSVINSTLFCCKSELCCDFAFFWGDTYGF